ncbi:MAG: DUF4062 domain-containing protein [Flavobacteriaceae bacterium]|nr:DUF4062 domain-containing protein [Flavobacteriaceae bacterium]
MTLDGEIEIMVASTVFGFQDQLSTICATISTLGYSVINSHIGTVRVNPNKSILENCLDAVRQCDAFVGVIRPYYGTGNIEERNITFEEIKLAIQLKKPYWFLVHRDVVFTKELKKHLYYLDSKGHQQPDVRIRKSNIFDERTLDIYSHVLLEGKPMRTRTGNWAQPFYRLDEALDYINAQFKSNEFITEIIKEGIH